MPLHIGIIMDGNRRYARQLGEHVLVGHAKGAATASKVLEWWIKYLPNTVSYASPVQPKYLLAGRSLPKISSAQRKSEMVFCYDGCRVQEPRIHQPRTSIPGPRALYWRRAAPLSTRAPDTMEMVEEITSTYDGLFLQIAVGYGGRQEVVSAVQNLVAQGKEITDRILVWRLTALSVPSHQSI
ncbi:Decaprenyl diphosphate synthase-like protein [Mycena galopus ATCC 62051]|nr:Decaprenyl diphosphate synthase-like protein [Mycena galopus ATCC 62051]